MSKTSTRYPTHIPDLFIRVEKAEGSKCPRCWNYDINIGTPGHHPELCDRCAKVLREAGIIDAPC